MTSVMQGDKVVRETKCKHLPYLYGEVIFWGHAKNGRLMVVCETPEGAFFVSDPSNLEKINDKVQQIRERKDNGATRPSG